MAKQRKEISQTLASDTMFNVKPIHVVRIKANLDAGCEDVTIHGDGMIFVTFTGRDGKLVDGKLGSEHHKEFNSGVAEINKDEVIARAKFWARYKRGEELPTTPEEIIQEFYDNQTRETQTKTKPEAVGGFKNAFSIADPTDKKSAE